MHLRKVLTHRLRALIFLCLMSLNLPATSAILGYVDFQPVNDPDGLLDDAVISPDGDFIYALTFSTVSTLTVFRRDPENGTLTQIQQLTSDTHGLGFMQGLAISPNGEQVFASGRNIDPYEPAIAWYTRDADTGLLTYGGKITQSSMSGSYGSPVGQLNFSPDGFYLYATAQANNGHIVVLRRAANGTLSYVGRADTQAVTGGTRDLTGLTRFSLSADGQHLYVVSYSSNAIVVFARNATTGALTHVQSLRDLAGLDQALDVAVSVDGRFVYTTGMIENDPLTSGDDEYTVMIFRRDTTTGELTLQERVVNTTQWRSFPDWDTLWGPKALAFSPDPEQRFLYLGNSINNAVNVFRRDSQTGSLTWLGWMVEGENGVTELNLVRRLLVSPDGHYLYAALEQSDGISAFDTRADLDMVKTDSADPVEPGASFSYTLSITNNGPSDATRLVVTDSLPSGTTAISATPNAPGASCTLNGSELECAIPFLAATGVVNIVVDVDAPMTEGTITNQANVTSDMFDSIAANNTDTETTCVQSAGSDVCSAPTPPDSSAPPTGGDTGLAAIDWPTLIALALAWFLLGAFARRHNG